MRRVARDHTFAEFTSNLAPAIEAAAGEAAPVPRALTEVRNTVKRLQKMTQRAGELLRNPEVKRAYLGKSYREAWEG